MGDEWDDDEFDAVTQLAGDVVQVTSQPKAVVRTYF